MARSLHLAPWDVDRAPIKWYRRCVMALNAETRHAEVLADRAAAERAASAYPRC